VSRLATGTRLRLAELVRQPLTLATTLLLPPTVVELYGVAVGSFPQLGSLGAAPETVGRMTGALFAVAFLAGLVGLFEVLSARRGDERAAVAGYPRWAMLTTRLVTMCVVALAGAAVAFLALGSRVDVADPAIALAVLVLAALLYGLLGVVVGTLVPRELEGSIVLVFVADIDNALSSGLFPIDAAVSLPLLGEVTVAHLAPLYHPHELFAAAVLEGELAAAHLLPAIGWVLGLLAVAFLAYGRVTGDGWTESGVSA
jgi:ABC-2 type transport system permease protein